MSAELNGNLTPEEQLTGALDTSAQLVGSLNTGSGGGGTDDYNDLSNKPKINNVTLSGNKTTSDLGLFSGNYNDLTNKPTIPTHLNQLSDVHYDPEDLLTDDILIWVNNGWYPSTQSYQLLANKPEINGHTLTGNKTTADLGLFSGDYDDLTNKPTIPAAQVNSDWNSVSGVSEILNKPTLATVATTGAYSDLSGTPDLTIQDETYTATKTSGAWVINKIQGKKFGHLYQLMIEFKGTGTSVAAGDNAFMGTITSGTIPSLPAVNSTFYYHTPIYLSVNNVGTIQVRIFNEALNFSSSDGVVISVMFLA